MPQHTALERIRARRGFPAVAAQPSALERIQERRATQLPPRQTALERIQERRAAAAPSLASRAFTNVKDFSRETIFPILETVKALPETLQAVGRQIERLPFTPSRRFGPLGDPTLGPDIIDMMRMPEGARLRDVPEAARTFVQRAKETIVPSELTPAGKAGRITGELLMLAAPVKGVKEFRRFRAAQAARAAPAAPLAAGTAGARQRFVSEAAAPVRGARRPTTGPRVPEPGVAPAPVVRGVTPVEPAPHPLGPRLEPDFGPRVQPLGEPQLVRGVSGIQQPPTVIDRAVREALEEARQPTVRPQRTTLPDPAFEAGPGLPVALEQPRVSFPSRPAPAVEIPAPAAPVARAPRGPGRAVPPPRVEPVAPPPTAPISRVTAETDTAAVGLKDVRARTAAARQRGAAARRTRDRRELADRRQQARAGRDRRGQPAGPPAEAAVAPRGRISASETRDIFRGREILLEKAGGPLPRGVSDQVDRLRVEYNRTQAEMKRLVADAAADPRETQRFVQAARELGSRLAGIERTTIRLARAAQKPALAGLNTAEKSGQQIIKGFKAGSGFGPLGALIKRHPAVAGATAGAAVGSQVFRDDPQAAAGLAMLLGLVGAKGVPKLMRLAAREPLTFERAINGLNAVRAELALTGTAIPKNLATLIGAPFFAGGETASLRPFKEALRMPANIRAFRAGFRQPIDIGIAGRRRPRGPVGRTISAIDKTAIEFLRRSGVPEKRLQELLLREPLEDIIGRGSQLESVLEHPIGRAGVLFQRTPFNVFSGGLKEVQTLAPRKLFEKSARMKDLAELSGPELRRRRLLTTGSLAAGAGAGEFFDDRSLGRLQVALLTAIMGRRALPFAAAAAATGGQEMLLGTTPLPEFGLNPRQLLPFPALLRLRDQIAEGR